MVLRHEAILPAGFREEGGRKQPSSVPTVTSASAVATGSVAQIRAALVASGTVGIFLLWTRQVFVSFFELY